MEREEVELMSTAFEDKKYYEIIRRALVSGFFMQVAKKEANGKTYTTVKDNQTVLLHPSTVLGQDSEWVVYNEFVLTTKNYVRTVTGVRVESLLVSLFIPCGDTACMLVVKSSGDIVWLTGFWFLGHCTELL